jgi:hypothetical protein
MKPTNVLIFVFALASAAFVQGEKEGRNGNFFNPIKILLSLSPLFLRVLHLAAEGVSTCFDPFLWLD